jgi:DNA-binding NarL/FixJ family response regulator
MCASDVINIVSGLAFSKRTHSVRQFRHTFNLSPMRGEGGLHISHCMTVKPSQNSPISSAIRVVLVGDRPDLSDRLSGLLNDQDGYAYVGSYGSVEQVVTEIRAVLEKEATINAVLLVKQLPRLKNEYSLTPHETRILKLLVAGSSYKAIATMLGVSLNTVSFHIRHIYDKLDVHSKAEAVAKALKNHLI